ncbi:GspH/FimT family pseudopilin [uncultured Methylibium sp.]|uniref:GspH/FimT family pseudopilin n=1 Tax=uncultured Methylibium sp. TaxID=381093 RepID=UPI0025D200DC|nr:GspH/FimT family pseudopilin [uncultured Methylibium sp.]
MKHAQRGLTFIETGATLAILASAATIALPGFGDVLQRRHTEGVASELATDLQYLRSEAVARNQSLRASFTTLPGGSSCYVLHSGPAGSCTCQSEGLASCGPGARALKSVLLPPGSRSSIHANVGSIVYDPRHGTSSPAATIRVTGSDGRAIHHVVNIMGRVRSCSPSGAIGGYREC